VAMSSPSAKSSSKATKRPNGPRPRSTKFAKPMASTNVSSLSFTRRAPVRRGDQRLHPEHVEQDRVQARGGEDHHGR
jgi:hypothetical protein